MNFALDTLLLNKDLQKKLQNKKIGLLANPASTDKNLIHSVDCLVKIGINLKLLIGPQHGIRGEKQDNMIESPDHVDQRTSLPVFSLYGKNRRPCEDLLSQIDLIIIDLQDLGCRIYTYETTLLYMLEACAEAKKSVLILDRPNPIGRKIGGFQLEKEFISFVGAQEKMPFQHGLSLAELALYFKKTKNLALQLEIIKYDNFDTSQRAWPDGKRPWVNPSPNIPRLSSAEVFPGSVLIEGTFLSEARGSTRPLESVSNPIFDAEKILNSFEKKYPSLFSQALFRPFFFEATFQKHQGTLCEGIFIHTDYENFNIHNFDAFLIFSCLLKEFHQQHPDQKLWHNNEYEYEKDKLAIDLIAGTKKLRNWVEESHSSLEDLQKLMIKEHQEWKEERKSYLLYED